MAEPAQREARDPILEEALSRRGTVKRISVACGISTAAVSQWRRVPADRIATVARITGISEERFREQDCDSAASESPTIVLPSSLAGAA